MPGVPYTVELGLGGSFYAQVFRTGGAYKFWRMKTINNQLSVNQEMTTGTPPTGWSSGDSLTIVGDPLLDQPSSLPEGGLAIRLDGSSQYLHSVYDETNAPDDIGPQTFEGILTIHALPAVGQEPAVLAGSTDFGITARSDGRIYGYYNGSTVVDLPFVLNEPLHVVLTRDDGVPNDTVVLYVNGVTDTATPATGSGLTRGFVHLGKHWSNAHYLEATYSYAGINASTLSPTQLADRFATVVWTDLADDGDADVVNETLIVERGIRDHSPIARVAATGFCQFAVNNSFTNSGGLTGYYSPGHANGRVGFQIGTPVRVTMYDEIQFIGRISNIRPVPGVRSMLSYVTATDILNDAARFRFANVPILIDVRSDEVFRELVARLPNQPHGLVVYEGSEVYPVALDNSRDEGVNSLQEYVRLAHSEFGYIYVTRHGQLVHENRDTRTSHTVSESIEADSEVDDLEIDEDTRDKLNRVEVTVHPRDVSDNPEDVLFALVNPLEIAAGETKQILGQYRTTSEQGNIAQRVGGIEMIAPKATTDYLMNSAQDGSGSDLTSGLQVVASYGANGVQYQLTNSSGSLAWVTRLQARGRGLFDFGEVTTLSEDQSLIAADGVNSLQLDMPYQQNSLVAELVAARIRFTAQDRRLQAKSFSTWVFEGDLDMPQGLLTRDVSDRIHLDESVSGVNGEYFINGIRVELQAGHLPRVKWWLAPPEDTLT